MSNEKRNYNQNDKITKTFNVRTNPTIEVLNSFGITCVTDETEGKEIVNAIKTFLTLPALTSDENAQQQLLQLVLDVVAQMTNTVPVANEFAMQFQIDGESEELTHAEMRTALEEKMGVPVGSFNSVRNVAVETMYEKECAVAERHLTIRLNTPKLNDWRLDEAIDVAE